MLENQHLNTPLMFSYLFWHTRKPLLIQGFENVNTENSKI